jgi:poly(A) polymerase
VSATAPGRALRAAHDALAETDAWLVGGAPRDRLLGRTTSDLDVVVQGSTSAAARAIARAAGGAACFELSAEFSGWRVVAHDHSWQVDVQPLRGGSLAADLALRDFTVNAIAEPLAGGAPVDPLGGIADLAAGRLRMAGPRAFADDPLRTLRLVRIALDLGLQPDAATATAASRSAGELQTVAGERIFMELRRIVSSPRVLAGVEMMRSLGLMAAVLPELEELQGVEQSRFHHRDVYGHTLEVLERTLALAEDPGAVLGLEEAGLAQGVSTLLAEPLADELTRGEALRWGALMHDLAKPLTRAVDPAGRITFLGHDARGAELARTVLGRLRASERLRAHVAGLVRNHLRLGFLVHEPQPLAPRVVFDYLRTTAPVEVDVTLLSVADRLATRGDRAAESIDAHLRLARTMLADALRWRTLGAPEPLLRGDELARELGIEAGPRIGELLAELAAAQYAGEIASREQALAHARARLGAAAPSRGD